MYERHAVAATSLGGITLVAHGDALVGIYFAHHWYPPTQQFLGERVDFSNDGVLAAARAQLTEYLAGTRQRFEIRTATHGDPFQEKVWALLNTIPYGETTTYEALAEQLGDKSLAREVGGAVGRNPLSVLVPCHRVIGKSGGLTGYAGGLQRKRFLLDLEGSVCGRPTQLALTFP